jgi:hypothetical protein
MLDTQHDRAHVALAEAHRDHDKARGELARQQAEVMRLQAVECEAMANLEELNGNRPFATKLRTFAASARESMEQWRRRAARIDQTAANA